MNQGLMQKFLSFLIPYQAEEQEPGERGSIPLIAEGGLMSFPTFRGAERPCTVGASLPQPTGRGNLIQRF